MLLPGSFLIYCIMLKKKYCNNVFHQRYNNKFHIPSPFYEMIQLYLPVLFSSCWRGRGLRQASTLHHDQTIMSQHAEWRHRRSGRWPIRSRAIDISYYRFLFPCEAGNKSTRANSKIFHGQGHIGEVFAAAEVCRAHRKIKQVQFVLQFCSLVFLQTVVCVLCVCVWVFFTSLPVFTWQGSARGTPTSSTVTLTRSSSCLSPDTPLDSLQT